jgi:hypothetical protein
MHIYAYAYTYAYAYVPPLKYPPTIETYLTVNRHMLRTPRTPKRSAAFPESPDAARRSVYAQSDLPRAP